MTDLFKELVAAKAIYVRDDGTKVFDFSKAIFVDGFYDHMKDIIGDELFTHPKKK